MSTPGIRRCWICGGPYYQRPPCLEGGWYKRQGRVISQEGLDRRFEEEANRG